MKINKSSRHSKITGDFSENLVLYWLSKYGFECAHVDHVGIDLIARNPKTQELMGISVKSRSRDENTVGEYLSLPASNFEKIDFACEQFGCVPYFAFVVDEGTKIHCFITSKRHFLELYEPSKKTGDSGWKMSTKALQRYAADPKVKYFYFDHETKSWW